MSDANPRKRGQGRGKRRTDAGPRTGPSSRGRRSRPPRRDAARSSDSSAPADSISPDVTADPVGAVGAVPGDPGAGPEYGDASDAGFIGDAPLPDSEGSALGEPGSGSSGAARPGKTGEAASGSARAATTRTATASSATQSTPPRGTPQPRLSQSAAQRLRKALLAVATVDGVALAIIIGVAIIAVTVTGAGFTPLPATIASMWMLLNLAPFGFGGTDLSLVPAVPAMLLFAAVAWRVRRVVADRIGIQEVRALAATFIAVPVALTITAWLMLWDASGVLRVEAPDFLQAIASTVVLHGGALIAGFGSRLLRALLRRRKLPEWPLGSLRLAAEYVGWLWAAGAVVTLLSLAWHHEAVRETMTIADSPAAGVALVLLSLAYLPNVAFGASGILTGAPANVGVAEAGLFAVTPGTLPPLPTLAAMPQSHLSPFFGVLLIVPVAIALWRVTVYVRTRATARPYVEVVVAALIVAVLVAVLALLLGGEVGQYGWSGISWWFAAVMASVWFVVPGAVAVVALTGVPSRTLADADADDAGAGDGADAAATEPDEDIEGTTDVDDAEEAADADVAETGEAADTDETADTDEVGEDVAAGEAVEDADADADESAEVEAEVEPEAELEVEPETELDVEAETELEPEPGATPMAAESDEPAAESTPENGDAGDDGDAEQDVGKQRG